MSNEWIHWLIPVLRESLAKMGLVPERDAKKVANSMLVKESAPDLLIGGIERRLQRPKTAKRTL